ncbi:hypothetical protein P154DRAFT_571534 [Amniculicola lignicola CBS 123094]|uniref:Uncharacterized protein n=1 Tax=Amniculicola lignicola CBS 123094 TaxID=1392246 RepID=A0A6A5WX58_9PLEO|nr:hypothetical protein P154DRAFT_571534 [Amniculicola lignicola CBS 123094]
MDSQGIPAFYLVTYFFQEAVLITILGAYGAYNHVVATTTYLQNTVHSISDTAASAANTAVSVADTMASYTQTSPPAKAKKPVQAPNKALILHPTHSHASALARAARYGVPIAGAALAGPIIDMLGMGPLGFILGTTATALSKFRIRQLLVGNFYAIIHAAGFTSLWGPILPLLAYLSLGAVFGPTGTLFQAHLATLAFGDGGFAAPLLGLSLSAITSLLGGIGLIPQLFLGGVGGIGGWSIYALTTELASYATFRALGWASDAALAQWMRLLDLKEKAGREMRRLVRAAMPYLSEGLRGAGWVRDEVFEVVAAISRMFDTGMQAAKMIEGTVKRGGKGRPAAERQIQVYESLEEWELVDMEGEEEEEEVEDSTNGLGGMNDQEVWEDEGWEQIDIEDIQDLEDEEWELVENEKEQDDVKEVTEEATTQEEAPNPDDDWELIDNPWSRQERVRYVKEGASADLFISELCFEKAAFAN